MDRVQLDEVPDQLSYQASVYVDPTQGWVGLVGFMTHSGYYAMWNCFRVDAGVSKVSFFGENAVDLADYTAGTWCTVRADLDYNALTADLWVDGNLLAEDVAIAPREFYEPGIGDMVLTQWGVSAGTYMEYQWWNLTNVVYFDDLSVWQSSTTVEVDIALGAGSSRTYVNLRSKGMLSVAVLSTESFDATQIDPATVTLAGAPVAVKGKHDKLMAHIEDVDGDGLLDMTFQFPVQALDPAELTEGLAVLTGATYDGQEFAGWGEVSVVPGG
ncbi:MAG: hypothetical protein JSV79_04455 [Armatimonadota bacterium]|nr:MAG: hypothetical protein JSV79_04455 [Armatimonadota bacterium]